MDFPPTTLGSIEDPACPLHGATRYELALMLPMGMPRGSEPVSQAQPIDRDRACAGWIEVLTSEQRRHETWCRLRAS